MRLGWPSADYAEPGCVYAGSRRFTHDVPIYIIRKHPTLTDERIAAWMFGGVAHARVNLLEPPESRVRAGEGRTMREGGKRRR